MQTSFVTKIAGRSLVGSRAGSGAGEGSYATNPTTGERLQPGFIPATAEEIELAVHLSAEAFEVYQGISGRDRGAFLRTIAAKIESIAAEIVERAAQETALPTGRLQAETGRTCAQLRLFAQVAEEGSWVQARVDHADPNRKPAPKPDIRSMLRPLGPVVVFGASNFPSGILRRWWRHCFRLRRRQHCNREGARGSSGHERAGWPCDTGECPRVRPARRCVLASVRQRPANRNGAHETSAGQSWGLHWFAHRGADPDGRRGVAPRADSVLCGDEQYESCIHSAGSVTRARRKYRDWIARIIHLGSGTVLHEAGNGISAPGCGGRRLRAKATAVGWRIEPISLADQGNSHFVRLSNYSSQEGNFRQTRGRGSETRD